MKLYIADQHFYHERLNQAMDCRGFPSIQEMNSRMISQWNSKVCGGDIVIVLGDMFLSKSADEVNAVLKKLNGKICLIEGNHDYTWLKKEGVNLNRFEWIKNYAEIEDHGNKVILSHYPVFCYNHQYQTHSDGSPRTFMLYGHVHNTHDEVLVNHFMELTKKTVLKSEKGERKIPCNMINCFCMFSDYRPLSLDEWIELDAKRRSQLPPLSPDGNLADE
ncbi:MAG: hypothetical protein VZR56_13640 [Treponema sp.]|nr:hypothetical protein [Treponema sp.]